MQEAIDYNALSWVRKELGETLRQARLELESYADGDSRNELLQRCAAQLHQARGPLRMVNLKGADLLACEMEEAIADLLLGTVTDQEILLEFLMQGFLELPEYLFSLRSGRQDAPLAMFPVINSLRATRGLEPLREEQIFSPNLSCRVPVSVFDVRAHHDVHDITGKARAARVRFQSGLLEWYRGGQENRGVSDLLEVLEYLRGIAASEPAARLWWVAAGVAELLRDGMLQESALVKRLFGQLDRNIKRLMDYGESVFSDLLTDDLLKNLLFRISQTDSDSARIRLIRQTYGLQAPGAAAAADPVGELSEELLQTLSVTAREDIDRIKDQVDACIGNSAQDPAAVGQVAEQMHALGNMLGMIELEQLALRVISQEQFLRRVQAEGGAIDFTEVANTLVAVEDALADISGHPGSAGGEDRSGVIFRQGQEAVIDAIMADMSTAKESINEFLKSDGGFDLLGNVPVLLHKISGGLVLAGEERLAAATDQVKRFITSELLARHRALDEVEFDNLADAICSIEYCVEQLQNNRNFEDRAILVAEQSLGKLGYMVTSSGADEAGPGTTPGDVELLPVAEELASNEAAEYLPTEEPCALSENAAELPAELLLEEPVVAFESVAVPQPAWQGEISALQVIAADADPEIVEIFIEEAGEVLEAFSTAIPAWCNTPDAADLLAEIRRGFHTIKGSGRMVGAMASAEFGWAFENLLNKVIEHVVPASGPVLELVAQSVPALQQLVAQVSDASRVPDLDLDGLARQAFLLGSGAPEQVAATELQQPGPAAELPGSSSVEESFPAQPPLFAERDSATPLQPDIEQPLLTADADPEIVDIFLEEAAEQLFSLRVSISCWIAQPQDNGLLMDVQRSFHTLKGSGRMAGAMQIGEFAWQLEMMLNRVLDGVLAPTAAMNVFLSRVPEVLQAMLDQLRSGVVPAVDIGSMMEQAVKLASGELPAVAAGHKSAAAVMLDAEVDAEPDGTLQELFATESGEHLAVLSTCVTDAGDSCEITEQMFRALHTLTGICESAQVPGIGALVEPLYEYFGRLYQDQLPAVPAAFAVLDDCVQEMQRQHGQLPLQTFDERVVARLQERIHALAAQADTDVAMVEDAPEIAPAMQYDLVDDVTAPDVPEAAPEMTTMEQPVVTEALAEQAAAEMDEAVAGTVEPVTGTSHAEPEVALHDADAVSGSMDAYAAMDPELFDIFVEESSEIMEAGETILRNWSVAPENRELMAEFQRMLHTLKGGARMVDIGSIGDLSHAVESLLGLVAEGSMATTPELFALLNESFDRLADMVDRVRSRAPTESATDVEHRLQRFMQGDADTAPAGPDMVVTETEASSTAVDDGETDTLAAETPVVEVVCGEVEQPGSEDAGGSAADTQAVEIADAADQVDTGMARPRLVAASPEFPAFAEMAARTAAYRSRNASQASNAQGRGEQVRIHADVLDSLVNNAGEINIYRSRMEQQVSNYRFNLCELDQTINRLRDQLRQLEMETEAQILYRFEQESDGRNEDFDPLEMDRYSNLQQLSRSLMESVSDLHSLQEIMEQTTRGAETLLLQQSRVNTDLQESLIRTRMVPFAGLAPRLRRIVRQTARELDKKVELELQGTDGEMDRSVADRIIAPLEHMIRNAIAHGIESPDVRTGSGKQASGNIRIEFDREGPEIVLRISDDGAGMNLPAIRERAIARGLMAENARLTDYEVMQFILTTGFSTATEVTQISGRGVGMDVVNSEVKQLGGSLHIDSETGKGTVFTVRLPYTLAINQALLVSAGDENFFVPLGSIEGVVRVFPEELVACYHSEDQRFGYAGNQYRLKHLGTLLGTGGMDLHHARQQVPVLLLRIGDQRVGMQVEALLGNREVVIKPLGVQFSTVEGISGATILGDGRVVLILDMIAISRMNAQAQPGEIAIRPQQDDRLLVMVVDDSITVRKVTSRLLERNGYHVLTAKDGVDAMGQLQETLPDIMLLDIEMPRMDGFELATHMRNDERLRHLPIIMITSRTGDKHRERAREIGVSEYLGKPYQESELLASIQEIIGVNTIAASG